MRVTAVIGLIGAGLLLAGCGSGTVSGDADAEETAVGEPVFSPCDDIPADLLRQVGVDPSAPDREFGGVEYPGWNRCRWPGNDFSVSVLVTDLSLDEVRAGSNTVNASDLTIEGRTALTYRDSTDLRGERCSVGLATGTGSSIVRVSVYHLGQGPEPCALATEAAAALSPAIPS